MKSYENTANRNADVGNALTDAMTEADRDLCWKLARVYHDSTHMSFLESWEAAVAEVLHPAQVIN